MIKNNFTWRLTIIFALLTGLLFLLFHRSFSVFIFADDFYHFYISQANNLAGVANFFRPLDNGAFYRPLPTQLFYFFIENILHGNLLLARIFIFATFIAGLIFLYQIVASLSKSKKFALIVVLVYIFNFTHVFQLYWLATFQEIAQLTFLLGSTYFFLRRKTLLTCAFFLGALFSKEQAILFPIFLGSLALTKDRQNWRQSLLPILLIVGMTIPFLLIHKETLSSVQSLAEYRFQFNPRLFANNLIWYTAWAIGFPSFLPDVTSSIFALPRAEFWSLLKDQNIRNYFIFLTGFLGLFIAGVAVLIKTRKTRIKTLTVLIVCSLGFIIAISPTLGVVHKWMVRLTLPSVFFAVALSYVFYSGLKIRVVKYLVFIPCIFLYFITQASGVKIHEDNSTYFFESSITKNVQAVLSENRETILTHTSIAFIDRYGIPKTGWEGSAKLKVTLSNDNFSHYFLRRRLKTYYGSNHPADSFVIFADQLIP